jgi:N-acetylglucosaminyldiphosphoundecaprenol N-acetyl-beta-D-mannosaminyltransferase
MSANKPLQDNLPVLGTLLALTDYAKCVQNIYTWAQQPRPLVVAPSNTQTVVLNRHDPVFREWNSACDVFLPDGMPLVWCLNQKGAGLADRVYGPTLMRECLLASPSEISHYVVGGSAEDLARLKERFQPLNPHLKIVGSYHGSCSSDGEMAGNDAIRVIEEINRLSPDILWICFGTPKQNAWIFRHKPQIQRGVLLAVGYALDVNAGTKPDAPLWMQRFGLTWLFRLASEPRRLLWRYLKYNTLFVWYLLRDGEILRRASKAG